MTGTVPKSFVELSSSKRESKLLCPLSAFPAAFGYRTFWRISAADSICCSICLTVVDDSILACQKLERESGRDLLYHINILIAARHCPRRLKYFHNKVASIQLCWLATSFHAKKDYPVSDFFTFQKDTFSRLQN
jgi:hypothetical protein